MKRSKFKQGHFRPGSFGIFFGTRGGEKVCTVRLTDELSGSTLFEAEIPNSSFADAFNSETDCSYAMFFPELAGLERQMKQVEMFVPNSFHVAKSRYAELFDKAFKPYEVDGWRGIRREAENQHRHRPATEFALAQLAFKAGLEELTEDPTNIQGGVYEVTFIRYVDPVSGDTVEVNH